MRQADDPVAPAQVGPAHRQGEARRDIAAEPLVVRPQQQQPDIAGVALARQGRDPREQQGGRESRLACIALQHQIGDDRDPAVDRARDRDPVGGQDRDAGGHRRDQEQGQDTDGQPAQRQTADRGPDHGFSE
jgi:hypothetical protein